MLLYGEKNSPHFPDLGQDSLQKDVSKYFISQVGINFQMFLKTKKNLPDLEFFQWIRFSTNFAKVLSEKEELWKF